MTIEVLDAGLFTTIQDLGRHGYRDSGVSRAGAVDWLSAQVLNIAVGNERHAPIIEMIQRGITLRFTSDTLIAIGGAHIDAIYRADSASNTTSLRLACGQPILVRAGSTIECGSWHQGVYGYIAIAGGIDIEYKLGSASTDLNAAFGGMHGRTLQAGDLVTIGGQYSKRKVASQLRHKISALTEPKWTIADLHPKSVNVETPDVQPIRCIRGQDVQLFSTEMQHQFWNQVYQISATSNRMGIRLHNEQPIYSHALQDMPSQPVFPGTIQCPTDGYPICLLADCQTVGGYPVIAHVITADLPKLAQVRTGKRIIFCETTIADAHDALRTVEREMKQLEVGISCWAST
jgi:biotin-dependent carboxylase-like uncharacterized protein